MMISAGRPVDRLREQVPSDWRIVQPLHMQPDFNMAK